MFSERQIMMRFIKNDRIFWNILRRARLCYKGFLVYDFLQIDDGTVCRGSASYCYPQDFRIKAEAIFHGSNPIWEGNLRYDAIELEEEVWGLGGIIRLGPE